MRTNFAHGAPRALALFAFLASSASLATEPAFHDVTAPAVAGQVVTVEWTGVSPPGSAGGGSTCFNGVGTDGHIINLTVIPGTYDNIDVRADFHINWEEPSPGSGVPDLVLTIEKDGAYIGDSDGGVPEENYAIANPESGAFEALVCSFAAPLPTDFNGRLTLTGVSRDATADSDGDGVNDAADLCPGTPEGTEVDGTGCPVVTCEESQPGPVAASSGTTEVDLQVLQEWSSLHRDANYGAFVHFFGAGTREQQDALLDLMGVRKTHDFRRYTHAVFVEGPVWAFQRLSAHPWISRIEYNAPLRYMDATQHWAMRTRLIQEQVSGGPYLDANGDPITGKGVRLGIMDSGMFGAHPDFTGHISHNWKYAVGGYIDVQDGDSENGGGGHGTHVSGIVAGNGTMSRGGYPVPEVAPFVEGTFTAAAYEAELIHWGHGAGIFVLNIAAAYQHLLDNISTDGFANLRAVNNSYGETTPGTPYNPNDANKQLIKRIVACGVNMVFAAGNDGGDGSTDQTSSYCKDPTPGVICVGSYNDEGTGRINGAMSGFSSRSLAGNPANYVDIAAPGDLSTSACAQATPTQAICTGGDDADAETEWQPWYGTISGTSMATPNITSVIGLLAQADPTLTPAEMEEVMQRTARKIGRVEDYEPDPQLPGSTIHFARGAGLVDVKAAMNWLKFQRGANITLGELRPVSEEWTIFDGDTDVDVPEAAADAIKLTASNVNLEGVTGVLYALTLADATAFSSSSLTYRVETFTRGVRAFTEITATPAEVSIPEFGTFNNALATFVEREGNVVSFFVPYSNLGFPPINEPIHNIRVVTLNGSGALDYAPSPTSPTANVASDAVQPMYGRAFTTRLAPGLPPPSSACELPGTRVLTDLNDSGANVPPEASVNILGLFMSELAAVGAPPQITFTLKVGPSLSGSSVNSEWFIVWNRQAALPDGSDRAYVGMRTDAAGTPSYEYGDFGPPLPLDGTPPSPNANAPVKIGDADGGSYDPATGTITIVVTNDKIENIGIGDTMNDINVRTYAGRNGVPGQRSQNNASDITDNVLYTLEGSASCEAPIARLVGTPTTGDAPLTVLFDASGSFGTPATGATVVSYTFEFDDGSAAVTQDTPTIEHTYLGAGDYTATVHVTDSDGVVSTAPGEQLIIVTGDPLPPPPRGPAAVTNNKLGGALTLGTLLLLGLAVGTRRR